jgi:ABC-type tungstate transport system permease subunit
MLTHKVLSDAFIKHKVARFCHPFRIAWFKSDTTESILYLKDGAVDVAITYTIAAEQLAIKQGIAIEPSYYAFRDHFLLVGPPSNPAGLDSSQDIHEMFSQIFTSAESGDTNPSVRFLSRFDKSATNIKESELWIGTGQVKSFNPNI